MVIMVMDMALKNKYAAIALLMIFFQSQALAGDWTFSPALSLNETYSDNIGTSSVEEESSLVNQASLDLEGRYTSKNANLSFNSRHSFYSYSHDSDLNDDTRTLSGEGSLAIPQTGFKLTSSIDIENINRNSVENDLDELIVENTVEEVNYTAGALYQVDNSHITLSSGFTYSQTEVDDNIGESEGYRFNYSTQNGKGARNIFWSSNGQYSDRENDANSGNYYNYELKIGWISPYKFTPFMRVYNENSSGNILSSNMETKSWGPGMRWKISSHTILDASYNYVSDNSNSTSDYLAATLQWEPSSRTSLTASYSKRFFGDSYQLNFEHQSKRLKNTIKYEEDLSAFDRNNYVLDETGEIELEDSNSFNLNKHFSWVSNLQLARTTFDFTVTNRDRENLETTQTERTFITKLGAQRRLNRVSYIGFDYQYENKDIKESTSKRADYYRTYSLVYTRNFLHELSTNFQIEHINRSSDNEESNYTEMRAILNLSKEF